MHDALATTWQETLRRNAVTEFQIDAIVRKLVARGVRHGSALQLVVQLLQCEEGTKQ